ncbi:sensor histidine kinase [Methanobacterium alcaliphilum]|uniref:sensor histidine kinase n=1 Tax=Methanobacterium alcaliphilum TaxID=392018 RepID=UPI00200A40DE|nr:sensor histidine kinase [Methanobacterium alcaliphilum]MCK9151734.1 sensor histidine kinase [Methanobacterium alcaliphilum]
MNKDKNNIEAMALSCNPEGEINELIYEDIHLREYFNKGDSLIDLVDAESREKACDFIKTLQSEKVVFDWELNINIDNKIITLLFSGFLFQDDLLIFAVKSRGDIEKFWEEIYKINSEQSNILRKLLKKTCLYETQAKVKETEYDELTRLNNELTNTQRELVKKNLQLEKALEEKDMLLKEIYHRVKNNLMVISSLLNLQSYHIKDKEALAGFKESQNRAKSMALIHEKLYKSTDLKNIDFGEYIRAFSLELYHSIVPDPSKIKLVLNVESVMLDINTSIPLGLIVNELITNSMKHAFPEGRSGSIEIDFYKRDDYYILKVLDDGVGIPIELDIENTQSLGLQLVRSLTEQINGELKINSTNGTEFKITFREMKFY